MQVHKALELELQAKIMGPMGALSAATQTNARLLRQENNIGTIAAGKLADLILVNGDPLKDISVLQKYETHITVILQNGRMYKNILD
jgi:imidazolonepropionase-like amidohydrolase